MSVSDVDQLRFVAVDQGDPLAEPLLAELARIARLDRARKRRARRLRKARLKQAARAFAGEAEAACRKRCDRLAEGVRRGKHGDQPGVDVAA